MVILFCTAGVAFWVLGVVTGYAAVIFGQQRRARTISHKLDRPPRWVRRVGRKLDREILTLLKGAQGK